MEVYFYAKDKEKLNCKQGSSVALGMFDGVHLGHKAVIQKAIDFAKKQGLPSAVITLANHPRELTQGKSPELITDLEQRLLIFERLGLDIVLVLEFDHKLMNTGAEEYLEEFLSKSLNAKFISTGYDHHFGKNREGNINFLKAWAAKKNIILNIEEAFSIGNQVISSSVIRQLIKDGKIREANNFLGHSFFIKSKVIHGDKRGSGIGFPTANLLIPANLVLPKPGVYSGECFIDNDTKIYKAAINIGYRPSFKEESLLSLEVHILDFDSDIYDKNLELRFLDHIRDEKKFASIDELRVQIEQDIKKADQAHRADQA